MKGIGSGLSRSFYYVLVFHTLFLTFTRIPGVFINTMMVGQGDGLTAVILYNGVFNVVGAACMVAAAKALYKIGATWAAVLGVIGYAALYVTVFALGGEAPRYSVAIGVISGLADGFYWVAYMQFFGHTTTPDNRDKGMAVIQFFGAIVSLAAPPFGSLIIYLVGGMRGYLTVFAVAFAIAAVTCLFAAKLPKISLEIGAKTDYRAAVRLSFRAGAIRSALFGQMFKGIREGAFIFILSVILYQLVRSELLIGLSSFLSGGAAILSFAVMTRILRPSNRIRYMRVAVALLCVLALCGFVWPTPAMIIAYGVINALLAGYVENTCYTTLLDNYMANEEAKARLPEMSAVNEWFLVIGRTIGLAVILAIVFFLGEDVRYQLLSLLILTVAQFFAAYFTGRASKGF